jgi:hypothetical protein
MKELPRRRGLGRSLRGAGDVPSARRDDNPAIACLADRVDTPMVMRPLFYGTQRSLPVVMRGTFGRGVDGAGPRVRAETFLKLGDGVLVAGRFYGGRGERGLASGCRG